ncbi:MAG: ATP-grasp domain-containing protein [Burkholderiales bacterium]|nr:ATP-grasp domain-containing protein [Burkholderiales bacterium]
MRELRVAGRATEMRAFDHERLPRGRGILLRLSDPLMVDAVRALEAAGIPYHGPGAAALEHCYDKWRAHQTVSRAGIDCPATQIATEEPGFAPPMIVKPRRGSDSLGLRVVRGERLPARLRNAAMLVQPQVLGTELTVGVIRGHAGEPLRIALPEGVPYTFLRKYLRAPRRSLLTDRTLAARVQHTALAAVDVLGVEWAARLDFIHERTSGRLLFLECDAAPLVGPASAFAASMTGGGMARGAQLAQLLGEI